MVAFNGRSPLAMSSVNPPEARVQGTNFTPHHYKPFRSHAHYQQVMCALRKLQESGFYWGAVGGREANARGTKNLRIHSEGNGFFLQPDPQNTQEPPQFDCVLKLITHYMGRDGGRSREGASGGNSRESKEKRFSVYLIHTGGERIPLELRRPLSSSLSSLQHMCRRTLNNLGGSEGTEQIPHTLRDYLEEYDAPI
ncbi:Suppressor of cytokine signaling 3 [Dissostichus eleginoides]|uniref:Suppressor of cytokine signaling 3 n=1 Tax=Dissostichus eleginoides TaxID=100907 RepID=A0AAD9BEE3_DISEL|nr:Suppressor of cytokine signaling 3 [Dissostichus eleginoides]